MRLRSRRRLVVPAVVATGPWVALAGPPAAAQDVPPRVVPALREWRSAPGTFELRPDARVVVRGGRGRRGATLRAEARTLARDLGKLAGRRVPALTRAGARTRGGDVLLTAGAAGERLGREGYALRVGRVFTIRAPSAAGAFYGGRTLLALARRREPIPRGRGRDWPRYPERGLMLDVGRRHYDRAWLAECIRQLARLKLNVLHLHLSDDEGFRIESRSHPEIVTAPALSRADVRALVAVARRHHVTIVPEIDMPGHMRAALAKHPELQLADAAGQRRPDKLDVTLPAARGFVADLLDEYLPLFPGPMWHAGADEYLGILATDADYALYPQLAAYARARHGPGANGKDAVLDFVAFVHRRVRAAGKDMRVWSDGVGGGSVLALDPRVSVQWWENRVSPTPAELVARGHRVVNSGWWPLYYVTGGPMTALRSALRPFYEEWRPWRFEGPFTARWATGSGAPVFTLEPDEPRQAGAIMAVWNDDPAAPGGAPDAVAAGIAPRLQIVAERTWGSPHAPASYAEFVSPE